MHFPRPAPPDSLVLIDATRSPPEHRSDPRGHQHTIQGPPQAVAITPDGRLRSSAPRAGWDEAAGKEVPTTSCRSSISATPPKLPRPRRARRAPNGDPSIPMEFLLAAAGLAS